VPVAALIHIIHSALPDQAERGLQIIAILFAVLLAAPAAGYLVVCRRAAAPGPLALIVVMTVSILLVAIYVYWVGFYVFFPADCLIWSESDYVNDILKFSIGYPIYSAVENNESFNYPPGSQLLTYFLAWTSGNGDSIPAYRAIQVFYTVVAAFVAVLSCRRLVRMAIPKRRLPDLTWWTALWLPVLFLVATNLQTNPYTHFLHGDSLAQLICSVAFWLMLLYIQSRDWRILAAMAVIPAAGFMTKQSLAIWAVLYCVYLAIFDQPRSWKRVAVFTGLSFGLLSAVLAGCYLLWGKMFFYWVIFVLNQHGVSPFRSFQHLLDVWPYFAILLIGGFVLLRGRAARVLAGPWLISLMLLSIETYTSGVAWMLNHIGPGCLLAGIWFMAALPKMWPRGDWRSSAEPWKPWVFTGIRVAVVLLLFAGLRVVRIPIPTFTDDVYRYVKDIEEQFEGQQADRILLDAGTWVYRKNPVIMKDRVATIGEQAWSETADFSGTLGRLRQKYYSKILVRNLHHPDFWYDSFVIRKPTGIKKVLLENYEEVGKIAGVEQPGSRNYRAESLYLFSEITILKPKNGKARESTL
jgi:hypothetical protein